MSGQKISFGTLARESDEEEEVDRSTRRGLVSLWRQFANPSVCSRFPWIDVRNDGIYCVYCNHIIDVVRRQTLTKIYEECHPVA